MSSSSPAATAPIVHAPGADIIPLLSELGDLKRVRSAGRDGTIATRLFRSAWSDLVAGRSATVTAMAITARALAAARMGDLDRAVLSEAGLSRAQITRILAHAVATVGGPLDAALRTTLQDAIGADRGLDATSPMPTFVTALEQQPRAGITCPGKPRILLEPPENHAEHCLMVAVYGVLLAPVYGADPTTVFLAGLAHHFHNAGMPDAGFTGEVLLGPFLGKVVDHYVAAALAELAPALRDMVIEARTILPGTDTPEGRTFHAADVLDRVLQISQHLIVAGLSMDRVLGEMALVHDGPVKPFHDAVLRATGLLP